MTIKPKSGAERRRERVALGLPRYGAAEAASRARHNKERKRRVHAERWGWVASAKLETGCVDCGYASHPAALDFDHLPGQVKVASVSELVRRNRPDAEVRAEIEKCEVVCANCHRIRTFGRKQ